MLNRGKLFLYIKRFGLAFSIVALLATDTAIGEEDLARVEREIASCSRPRAKICCALIRFYRITISPIGASSCRMYPSCSAFAHEAFENHGFFHGMMLTSDRLMRDTFIAGTEYPLIRRDGQWLLYDPVSENTWWWQKSRRRTSVGRAR